MVYQKRIVCFFDILGFGKVVFDKVKTAEEIDELFQQCQAIINEYRSNDILISFFSDCIAISIKSNNAPTQLHFIRDILIKLLEHNFLARGAIVYGELFHTDKFIFGPALVKAAQMEKTTKFPRIVLDASLDETPLPTMGNAQVNYRDYFNNFLPVQIDSIDDEYYIDVITCVQKIKDPQIVIKLKSNLKRLVELHINNECLKEKYTWIEAKLLSLQ